MKRTLVGLALALVLMLAAFALLNRQPTPYALIDLAETDTEDEQRAFVALATAIADELGGHAVLVNRALVPMIVPPEQPLDADQRIRLVVITEYPDEVARVAIDQINAGRFWLLSQPELTFELMVPRFEAMKRGELYSGPDWPPPP